ncbi:MAG: hypothetical protein ABIC40_03530 [bacterium]
MKSQSVCFRSPFPYCDAAGIALCDILEHVVSVLILSPVVLVNRSGSAKSEKASGKRKKPIAKSVKAVTKKKAAVKKKSESGPAKPTARSSGKKTVKPSKSAKSPKKTAAKKAKTVKTEKPKKTPKPASKKAAGKKAAIKKVPAKQPKPKKAKAQKTRVDSKVKSKTALKQRPVGRKAKEKERNRRRPRIYSSRSSLSDFLIGDQIIFKQVRDWNRGELIHEMRGMVTGMGMDSEQGINYIEVEFEVISFTGIKSLQRRRFAVK